MKNRWKQGRRGQSLETGSGTISILSPAADADAEAAAAADTDADADDAPHWTMLNLPDGWIGPS